MAQRHFMRLWHSEQACLDEFMVLDPPAAIIGRFAEAARSVFTHIETPHCQSKKAAAARDLLLPRLMSGEVAA